MKKKKIKKVKVVKPIKTFVSYRQLVDEFSNWGQELEKKEATEMLKHPNTEQLTFAFLVKIVDLLREIRDEVKRERKIS